MRDAEQVLFAGGGHDRAAPLRGDEARLAALAADPAARALPIWRGKALVSETREEGGFLRLAWLPLDHPFVAEHGGDRVFLGLADGAARFAVDVSGWEAPDLDAAAMGRFADGSLNRPPGLEGRAFAELRAHMGVLDAEEAGVAATAKGVLGWHATHGFCARCGAASRAAEGGWRRACPECGGQHFPRTDPVVIMLVTRGQSVLIGRQAGWPEGMHSLLAGFVEPGESLEAAVRRETLEEAGIAVGRVTYLASQPWPLPVEPDDRLPRRGARCGDPPRSRRARGRPLGDPGGDPRRPIGTRPGAPPGATGRDRALPARALGGRRPRLSLRDPAASRLRDVGKVPPHCDMRVRQGCCAPPAIPYVTGTTGSLRRRAGRACGRTPTAFAAAPVAD
jgi:NAD+ diphosphatase